MKTYTIEEIYDVIALKHLNPYKYRDEYEEDLKEWNKKFPGLLQIYKQREKENKAKAEIRIAEISKRFAELFDPVNIKVCSTCKIREKGCCNDCYSSHAHFRGLGNLDAKREFIKLQRDYGWNEHGFWSKEGCLLPREKRSYTCQQYYCDYMAKEFSQAEREELSKLKAEIQEIRGRYCVLS